MNHLTKIRKCSTFSFTYYNEISSILKPQEAVTLKTTLDISPAIGEGIYSVTDAANILGFPVHKVRRWIKTYWEDRFVESAGSYTWGEGRDRGFNFHTLVELIAIYALREKGVSFHKIIEVRQFLQNEFNTEYPFASKKVISDGKRFYFAISNAVLLDVNLKRQTSIKKLVEPYCKKLDFDAIDKLANQFWPLGKERSVVVDPKHRFGEPVIDGTNISVDVLASMVAGGDPVEMVAELYHLKTGQVKDAVAYVERAQEAA
jgi:uncharacterized protein (DUF433 family)